MWIIEGNMKSFCINYIDKYIYYNCHIITSIKYADFGAELLFLGEVLVS